MRPSSHIASDSTIRVRNHSGACGLGTIVELSRNAVVFELYRFGTVDQLSAVLPEVLIRRGETEIYTGRATVTDVHNTGFVLVVSAYLMDPWSDATGIYPGPQPRAEIVGFVDDWRSDEQHIQPGYRLVVARLKGLLAELQPWIERCERMLGLQTSPLSPQAVEQFTKESWDAVQPALDELLERFAAAARQVPPCDLPPHWALACRELLPFLLCAPFLQRIYVKPLGHAADFQLVDMMFRDGWQGSDAFSRLLNAVCLTCGVVRAYRDRSTWLKQQLALESRRIHYSYRRNFRVLCVGSAAAIDIREFLQTDRAAAWSEFHLLDFEPANVEAGSVYLQDVLRREDGREAVHLICRPLPEVVRGGDVGTSFDPPFDFVYCSGGLDYFDDRTCKLLLRRCLTWTRPGETLAAMSLHADSPVARWIEHLGQWHLRARAAADVRQWGDCLRGCQIDVSSTGPNVVFLARKGRDRIAADGSGLRLL